jgi:hypothetical protein
MAYVDTARTRYRGLAHDSDDSANGETEFNEMTDYVVTWVKDAVDATAGVETTNHAVARVPYAARVVACHWTQKAATTANATSYATLTLNKNDGAASTFIAVGTVNTQSDDIASHTAVALTLTAANVAVTSGGCLFINIAKTSSGNEIQPGALSVVLRRV